MLSLKWVSYINPLQGSGNISEEKTERMWEVQDEERCEVLGFEHDVAVAPVHSQKNFDEKGIIYIMCIIYSIYIWYDHIHKQKF